MIVNYLNIPKLPKKVYEFGDVKVLSYMWNVILNTYAYAYAMLSHRVYLYRIPKEIFVMHEMHVAWTMSTTYIIYWCLQFWHRSPLYPDGQLQMYDVPDCLQSPPFKHGWESHGFTTENKLQNKWSLRETETIWLSLVSRPVLHWC